jgi:serine/threonine-protein kinase
MSADSRLSDLLLRWEEMREHGQPIPIEDLCRDCPELTEELRRRVQALEALDPLMRLAPTIPDESPTSEGEPDATDSVTAEGEGRRVRPGPLPIIPGYKVLRELGRGGMGVVYEARQAGLGRLVALKTILLGPRATDSQRKRFRTEAEAVARMQHPNIVQIHEVGEVAGQPYCVLELVDGGSLADRLDGRHQPPGAAAQLVATLAEAVHAAHLRGIVHRDLKPGNVLLTRTGTPKIADFGLAKRMESAAGLTSTGVVLGTASYMAPEQAAGKKDVGPASDIHALGAILYELLTGRPPFGGATVWETLEHVQRQEPVPPSQRWPDVPRDLEAICLKCLRKDPARRYADAQELAEDLHRFLKGEPVGARPLRPWERALKWARRRPAAAALLGVSGLAVIALLVMGLVYNTRLRAERDEAERQRRLAAASAAVAGQEKEEADRLRGQAEASFRLAREVVDEYATTLNEDEHAPAEELRRQLLQSTLEFYEEFAKQRGEDPALRVAQGRAYLRLACLTGEFGAREARALALYRDAADTFERLLRKDPENATYQRELALVRYHQGRALRDLGRFRAARESLTQARALQEHLVDHDATSGERQRTLADIWLALGLVEMEQPGGYGAAESAYRKALTVMQVLGRERAPTAADEDTVGDIYYRMGELHLARGEVQQAKTADERALAIAEKLVQGHPATINYRSDLARCCCAMGTILQGEGRTRQAREAQQKALGIRQRLVEEHPGVTQLGVDLAASYLALGRQSETPAAQVDWLSKAVQTLQGVRAREPHDHEARGELVAACEARARALNRLGRYREALTDWQEAEQVAGPDRPTVRLGMGETLARLGRHAQAARAVGHLHAQELSANQLVELARVYALCWRAADRDAGEPRADRASLADQYAVRAAAALSQAGRAARSGLTRDPDFEPLRDRADFRGLLGGTR